MALFRKFFYRKPPDGLLEISERVHVFDCCFTTDIWEGDEYKVYIGGIVSQLRDYLPDASFMVFNFREGDNQTQISSILSEYDMTVMEYPRQYEGCPLLTMEMIHHFLRSSESWLSLAQQNVLLMHCERGGWPVLAFMLAGLLIYRKQFSGEQKTLDMVYKQAPRELVQLMSPLNPLPSQMRYLQYISRRNVGSEWPPLDRTLTLDCVILRVIPNLDGKGGCCPIFRIYGQDPLMVADRIPKVLYSTPKTSKLVRHCKQADCELVKIDINCRIQGDVVMECINLDADLEREQMMFRVVFNTAFIRSNILILNRDEIDTLWDAKDQFPKDFRSEVLFSEMDSTPSLASIDLPPLEEKDGLPAEAFAKVHEIFSILDWSDAKTDLALNALQHITTQQEKFDSPAKRAEVGSELLESTLEKLLEKPDLSETRSKVQSPASASPGRELVPPFKSSEDANLLINKIEPQELKDALQSLLSSKLSPDSVREKFGPQNLQKLRDPIQSVPSKLPVDAKTIGRKAEQQEPLISLQRPLQSKIISQRLPQTSKSSPASHSSSLQGSPVPISRYHSAPSALGITALLHDHAASSVGDGFPSSLPLPSSDVSSSVKSLPSQLTPVSTKLSPPPPPPPVPPPIPPEPTTKAADSFVNRNPEMSVTTIQSSSVPLVPPPLSGSSTSAIKKESLGSSSTSNIPASFSDASQLTTVRKPTLAPPPPPPPPHSFPGISPSSTIKNLSSAPPPPPPPPPPSTRDDSVPAPSTATPHTGSASVPPPPPPPGPAPKEFPCNKSPHVPPPPPAPLAKGSSKANEASLLSNGNVPPVPGPPSSSLLGAKGQGLPRPGSRNQSQTRKANLKPYHWLKLTRAMQGSLWAEAQKPDEASQAPEIDMKELESLFSAAAPNSDRGSKGGKSSRRATGPKSDKVQLIELRRAYNCEIMLSKVKIPLPDLMNSVLTLDDSGLDVDQIDNLIKFCPTKEEMELLKGYNGDKENLGKCEQFFLQLMKVPRVESKLRVFSFKLQFHSQVSDLRRNLNVINSTAEEVRNSVKLKRIMQTILSLGNALNQGTARGSAVGFRLDSLLKLTDTRARNGKMTLMHYLCKVLAEKLPELLDFPKDLVSLEAATKVQLKYLAEEMQAISKGLEKVVQELTASENDGPVSENFCKILKAFLVCAESEVRSLASLYSNVGRNADALAFYFGEDPARCPFEQVVSTLLNFVRMFVRAHDENFKQIEYEKKRAAKVAETDKVKTDASKIESGKTTQTTSRNLK